jgi:tRNA dimethylallyltransferase
MSPDTADALNESDRANPRRLIRRIEILKYRGSLPERTARYQYRNIAGEQTDVSVYGMPFASRDTVRKTITARVDARLRAGAIEETRRLIKRGVGESAPGFNTIGYVQILQFLRGTVSAEEMRAAWITAEVRYTKRQMTFMRKDPNILWLTDGK